MTDELRLRPDRLIFAIIFIVLALLCSRVSAEPFGNLMRTNDVAMTSDLTSASNALSSAVSAKIDTTNGVFYGSLSSTNAHSSFVLDADNQDLYIISNGLWSDIWGGALACGDSGLIYTLITVNGLCFYDQSNGGSDLYDYVVKRTDSDTFVFGDETAGATTIINGDVQISQGDIAADTLTLDSAIDEWIDLEPVFTNFISQNTPITITNDSSWTGWTTTGDLVGEDIFLEADEYLLSPVQTNGIADFTVTSSSASDATALSEEAVLIGATLGSEIVGDPEFADIGWWSTDGSCAITGGEAVITSHSSGPYGPSGTMTAGKNYRAVYTVSAYTGNFTIGLRKSVNPYVLLDATVGTHTNNFEWESGETYSYLYPRVTSGSGSMSLSSFSVKEVISTGTNTISVPYHGTAGQVRITAGETVPGATPGVTVSSVDIVGYDDLVEAAQTNYVSGLCRIEAEVLDCDVTRKVYVDELYADALEYTADAIETYSDDADKTLRGAELRLGNMWVVSPADTSGSRFIVSGGEISGDGELVGTTNEFILAKNDYPLMSFTSDSSGLYITNFTISATSSNATLELFVATNGVTAAPFAEWTEDLVVGEWSRVLTYATNTYPTASNGTYELEFTVPATNTAYFRAVQQIGDSVATVHADVLKIEGQLEYVDSVWDDMTVSALTLNVGSGAPGLITYSGDMKQMNYDSGDSSFGQVQFSHRKEGTLAVRPHIHWSSIDDRSSITNIQFKLDALYGPIGGLLTNSYTDTITVTGSVAFYHKISSFDSFGEGVLDESSIVMFEIECVEDGGDNNKVFIHDIDFHYQIDKPGSNDEIPD